jgi:hypothetical protein
MNCWADAAPLYAPIVADKPSADPALNPQRNLQNGKG